MKIISMVGKYGILTKDEVSGKILGNTPTIFQIEVETSEEYKKVMSLIEALL